MKWQVEFYKTIDNKEPVKDWLDSYDLKTKMSIQKYFEKMHRKRLNLKHSFITHLETQLYEMNICIDQRVFKIIFFPNAQKKIVLLHGFIKHISKKSKQQKLVA